MKEYCLLSIIVLDLKPKIEWILVSADIPTKSETEWQETCLELPLVSFWKVKSLFSSRKFQKTNRIYWDPEREGMLWGWIEREKLGGCIISRFGLPTMTSASSFWKEVISERAYYKRQILSVETCHHSRV